jgi:hypothetical protein
MRLSNAKVPNEIKVMPDAGGAFGVNCGPKVKFASDPKEQVP